MTFTAPAYNVLADEADRLDWDANLFGHMADYEAPAPETLPYQPGTRGPATAHRLAAALPGVALDLPGALARRGLQVEVVPGWETRSAGSFNPHGAVCHWTAGPRNSNSRPSLSIVVNGRSDLSGPLCNVYLARDGVAVVVAAGRANHAGAGGWHGLVGNSSVWGTECELAGDGDWTEAQRQAYPLVNLAYMDISGFPAGNVCGHNEWAPTRKIDVRDFTMVNMRAAILNGGGTMTPVPSTPAPSTPTPTPVQGTRQPDHLPTVSTKTPWGDGWAALCQKVLAQGGFYSGAIDAKFGAGSERALKAAQSAAGITADGLCGMQTWCIALLGVSGTLRQGSGKTGAVGELLQNLVGLRGGDLDTILGPNTMSRVEEVQRWGGVTPDRVVGADTRRVFARG